MLEEVSYSCEATFDNLELPCYLANVCKKDHQCTDPIEKLYYSCVHCGQENQLQVDNDYFPQYQQCQNVDRVKRPPKNTDVYMYVTGFTRGVFYAHNFKSHFSPPFNRYNNRLTVHACSIAKSSTIYFYWGLIHGPVWRPSVLGWSVNGSNFPGQTDSWQRITTGLAGETGNRSSYILWYVELKTAWIHVIWLYKFSLIGRSHYSTSWLPTTPHPPPL